jgi:predicted lipid carrier protein YhbT
MLSAVKHQLAQTILSQAPRLTRRTLAMVPNKLKLEVMQKVLSLALKQQLQQAGYRALF